MPGKGSGKKPGDGEGGFEGQEPPVELESALARFDNDEDFYREMLGKFLELAPAQLERLAEAISSGDGQKITITAHGIKGAARTLGAVSVADLARCMEETETGGDRAALHDLLERLREAFRQLEAFSDSF